MMSSAKSIDSQLKYEAIDTRVHIMMAGIKLRKDKSSSVCEEDRDVLLPSSLFVDGWPVSEERFLSCCSSLLLLAAVRLRMVVMMILMGHLAYIDTKDTTSSINEARST